MAPTWRPIKCKLTPELRNGHWYVPNGGADDILQIESKFKVTITNPDKTKKWTKVGINWIKDTELNRNRPDPTTVRLITTNYEVDEVSVEELNTYFWSSSQYEKYLKILDKIEVGDYVRCSGFRDTLSWRKITEIHDFHIVGQKYQYRDGKFTSEPYMSTNEIKTITQLIKKDIANVNCT